MVTTGHAQRDDIIILGHRSVSVCLYVCLCVQSGTISKFPRCPVVSILRVPKFGVTTYTQLSRIIMLTARYKVRYVRFMFLEMTTTPLTTTTMTSTSVAAAAALQLYFFNKWQRRGGECECGHWQTAEPRVSVTRNVSGLNFTCSDRQNKSLIIMCDPLTPSRVFTL